MFYCQEKTIYETLGQRSNRGILYWYSNRLLRKIRFPFVYLELTGPIMSKYTFISRGNRGTPYLFLPLIEVLSSGYGIFFDELCLIMNSYIVFRISYRVKDKAYPSAKPRNLLIMIYPVRWRLCLSHGVN